MLALAAVTVVCGYVAVDRFKMNSDLGELIRQDAPWRLDFDQYEAEFPHLVNTLVLVVSGDSPTQVDAAARSLAQGLNQLSDQFSDVYAPGVDPFLRDHAFYYFDAPSLDDVVDELAAAQPMLSAVSGDPSLRSVLGLVRDGVQNNLDDNTAKLEKGVATALRLLNRSAGALLEGDDATVLWGDEFFSLDGLAYQLVVAKGALNFGEALPNGLLVEAAARVISAADLPASVNVGITGEVALSHEEIGAALEGVKTAGWVSLVLLAAVLIVGVRSAKIIIGIFLMLAVGVVWTSAYAMLAVGEYNTLSVVFLVMFFGLGVDFAVHFSLRYQESINAGVGETFRSMRLTTHSVGGAISLCTLTTAIAFLGFWPTDYKGLADLGVISAGGMLVAALLTFSLLPAWYAMVGRIRPHVTDIPSSDKLVNLLISHRSVVLIALIAIAVGCGWVAMKTHFDYSVLALRDESAPSMRTLRTLQQEKLATDYSLAIVTDDPNRYNMLQDLPEVDSVVMPADLVPKDQQDKQYVLEDAQQILWNLFESPAPLPAPGSRELETALSELIATLTAAAPAYRATQYGPLLAELRSRLVEIAQAPSQLLQVWQPAVVKPLLTELSWVQRALQAQPFTFEDVPAHLARNFRSPQGKYLMVVNPAEDMSDVGQLNQFVQAVQTQAPQATGRAVIEWGVGAIVLDSFLMALAIAAVGVLLVLLINFRSLTTSLLILVPLALAMVITLAIGVWVDQPLNMANILVLPLIFGLGVDNGIHVVDRYRGAGDVYHLMHSSTPRAVMLSTLTTIGTFASLMLSPHQGTASIGFLLTCAVSLVLFLTVFVLPVLLSLVSTSPADTGGGGAVNA